jgi:hypothetical protein
MAAASQPGVPVPPPVRTIAAGPARHGFGAWALVLPPASSESYLYYGESLIEVKSPLWAGVDVGFAPAPGCPSPLPQRDLVVAELTRLLADVSLVDAHASTTTRLAGLAPPRAVARRGR